MNLVEHAGDKGPEFSVSSTGDVVRGDGNIDPRTVAFFDGPSDRDVNPARGKLFVRLYAASSRTPQRIDTILVWEGLVNPGEHLRLPKCDWGRAEDTWRLEAFTSGAPHAKTKNLTMALQGRNRAASAPAKASTSSLPVTTDPERAAETAALTADVSRQQSVVYNQSVQEELASIRSAGVASTWLSKQQRDQQSRLREAQNLPAFCKNRNDRPAGDGRPPPTDGSQASSCQPLVDALQKATNELASTTTQVGEACKSLGLAPECNADQVASFVQQTAEKAETNASKAEASATAAEDAAKDAAQALVVATATSDAATALAQSPTKIVTPAEEHATALVRLAVGAATLARTASNAAAVALDDISALHWDCYTHFGTFDLPWDDAQHTVQLALGGGAAATSTAVPAMHKDGRVTAFATHLKASTDPAKRATFTWQSVGKTSTGLATVLAQAVEALGVKAPTPSGGTQYSVALTGGFPRPSAPKEVPRQEAVEKDICPFLGAPVAQYRSAVQSSDALEGGIANGRVYSVTVRVGDGTTPDGGTWKVTKGTDNGELYEVNGPKLQAGGNTSGSTPSASANQAQAQFRSREGGSFALLTSLTYDRDVAPGRKGYFPSYQWRPAKQGVSAGQVVYSLDDAYQPLQNVSASLLVSYLFSEGSCGRPGLAFGPTLLWGTGVNGALQQWTGDFVFSPAWNWSIDQLYLVVGGGFRVVPDLVGDVAGETVAVPRTNGNAPVPSGPTTRSTVDGVVSIGIGFNLAAIGQAVSSVTGIGSSSGGK